MVKEQVPHLWPLSRVLPPWPMGERFFWETKRGVLSYVIARPLMTAVSVVANIAGVYGEGEFRRDRAYPYVALVNNFAQAWALYCLVLLYQVGHRAVVLSALRCGPRWNLFACSQHTAQLRPAVATLLRPPLPPLTPGHTR
jgi:hypothetical protein